MLLANRVAKGLAEHDPDAIDGIDAAVHARTLLAVSRNGSAWMYSRSDWSTDWSIRTSC
ncbi:hypothetical protein ACWFPY_36840 [Nocardia fluminea]